ncbi:MAG: hypothetical protein IKU68_01350 [Oscillospiraceae bacterium]|nr:hypothetical protein [Oscillospiraceae bacterium]
MMLAHQVYAQAVMLAGQLEDGQAEMLRVLCEISVTSLTARLRDGITPEDCKAEFIAAASLYALAALNEAGAVEEFRAGDLTVKRGGADAASRCLHRQAEVIIGPMLKDRFSFRGV